MGTASARRVDGLDSAGSANPECGPILALVGIWGKVRKNQVKASSTAPAGCEEETRPGPGMCTFCSTFDAAELLS